MPRKFTPEGFSVALDKLIPAFFRGLTVAMKPPMSKFRRKLRANLRSTNIGRSLWGKGRKGKPTIPMIVKTSALAHVSSTEFVDGVSVRGVAAMLVQGGKIEPHVIEPSEAQRLVFDIGGEVIVAKRVEHPGMTIQGRNTLLDQPMSVLQREAEAAAVKLLDKSAKQTLG